MFNLVAGRSRKESRKWQVKRWEESESRCAATNYCWPGRKPAATPGLKKFGVIAFCCFNAGGWEQKSEFSGVCLFK